MTSIRPSTAEDLTAATPLPSSVKNSRPPEEITRRNSIRAAAAEDLEMQLSLPVDPRVKAFLEKMAAENNKNAENDKK